jgi:hypothetical protein
MVKCFNGESGKGKGLAIGSNLLGKRWWLSNGWHHKVGNLGFYLGMFWQMSTMVESLERRLDYKVMMFLGDRLGYGSILRREDLDFTMEIQAYRWLVQIFGRNLVIFSPKKKKHWSGQSSIGVCSVRTELVMGYLMSGQSSLSRSLSTILFFLFLGRTMVVAASDRTLSINTRQRR